MKRVRDIPLTDWIIAAAAVIGIFVAIRQTGIAARQTTILGQQQADAKSEATKTAAIKVAQQDMADSSERFATASERSATAMRDAADRAKDSLTETTTQNRKSLDQSRKSLEKTIEMSRNDQRAWVGAVRPEGDITVGKPLKLIVTLKNCGRTPALRVMHGVLPGVQPYEAPFAPDYSAIKSDEGCSALAPGEEIKTMVVLKLPLTPGDQAAITDRKIKVYLYGTVTYDDTFGRQHHTLFGYYMMPSQTTWALAGRNEMD